MQKLMTKRHLMAIVAVTALAVLGSGNAFAGPKKKKKGFDVHGLLHGIGDILSAAHGQEHGHPDPGFGQPGMGPGPGIGPGPGVGGPPNGIPGNGKAPLPNNPLPPAKDPVGGPVVLMNPPENGATISYLLDGKPYNLPPGYMQGLDPGRRAILEFDRGAKYGVARYSIADGTFLFRFTQKSWGVIRKTFEVTIDNEAGGIDFHYQLNEQPMLVKAGLLVLHKSRHPMVVRFHNGADTKLDTRTVENGRYVIAVNPETQRWDLLPALGTDAGSTLASSKNPLPGAAGGSAPGIQPIGGTGPPANKTNPLPKP